MTNSANPTGPQRAALRAGAVVQYRKVGRARLIERASDYVGSSEDWRVEFLTGRYRNEQPRRGHVIWVSERDVIAP